MIKVIDQKKEDIQLQHRPCPTCSCPSLCNGNYAYTMEYSQFSSGFCGTYEGWSGANRLYKVQIWD